MINNVHVPGAVLAYKNVWFMWRVASPQDVTPNSLAFLRLLRPVPDLLVLGTGARAERPSRETLTMLKSLGIAIETLTTVRAMLLATSLTASCCLSWMPGTQKQ